MVYLFGFTCLPCSFYQSKKQGGQTRSTQMWDCQGRRKSCSDLLTDKTLKARRLSKGRPLESFATNLICTRYSPSLPALLPTYMSVRTQKSIEVKGWNKFKTSVVTYHTGLHLRSLNIYCMSQCVPLPLTHAAVSLIWMITCGIVGTWVTVFIWVEPFNVLYCFI